MNPTEKKVSASKNTKKHFAYWLTFSLTKVPDGEYSLYQFNVDFSKFTPYFATKYPIILFLKVITVNFSY